MSALTMGSVVKGAGATKDYAIDFQPFLQTSEKVVTAVYVADPVSLTIGSGAYAATIDSDGKGGVVWLSGGTPGLAYVVTVTFTTNNVPPRIEQRTFDVVIEAIAPPVSASTGEFDAVVDFGADPTGTVDATEAIRAALLAAYNYGGGEVYLRAGRYRVGTTTGAAAIFTIPRGVGLRGRSRLMDFGPKQYNVIPNVGTQLNVYGTGKLFTMEEQSKASDLLIYYPDQQVNAAPTVYDYAFYCAAGHHGPSIERIVAPNVYRLMSIGVNGATIDAIQAMPLSRGIDLGRCAEVVRVSRVLFNPGGVFGTSGATLTAWVLANGTAFSVDGAEGFSFTDCFAGGYAIGLDFKDLDTDAQTSYGSWRGGGLEGCLITIRVAEPTGLASLFISDVGLVGGSSGSHVIDFQDTTAAANHPEIHATNVGFWGSSDAIVNMGVNSHGRYIHHGGRCVGYTGYAFRASGANTVLRLTNHGSSTTNRVDVASIGDTKDEGTWVL